MTKYRNHPISILSFKFNFSSVIVTIVASYKLISELFSSIKDQDSSEIILYSSIIVALILLFFGYRIRVWYKTFYYLEDNGITQQKITLFSRNIVTIKRNSITSIHSSQPIIYRLLNINIVSITTNTSVGNKDNSIDLSITDDRLDEIEQYFKHNDEEKRNTDNSYEHTYSPIDAIKSYLVDNIIVKLFFLLVIFIEIFVSVFTDSEGGESVSIALIIVIIPALFSLINGISKEMNLTVKFDQELGNIYTSHGLFTKTEFTFNKNDIRVVEIKHNRLLDRYTIDVEVVGLNSYDDDIKFTSHSISLLCKKERVEQILDFIGYNYKFNNKYFASLLRLIPVTMTTILLVAIIAFINYLVKTFSTYHVLYLYASILLVFTLLLSLVFKVIEIKKYNCFSYSEKAISTAEGFITITTRMARYKDVELVMVSNSFINDLTKTKSVSVLLFNVTVIPSVMVSRYFNHSDVDNYVNHIERKVNRKEVA